MASESTGEPGGSTRRALVAPAPDRPGARARARSAAQTAISGDLAGLAGSSRRAVRDLGTASWLLLGALGRWRCCLDAGKMSGIVGPVLVGFVVACVASPVVGWLERRGWKRGWGSLTVLLALVGLGVLMLFLVIGGIVSQSGTICEQAGAALDKVSSWLKSLGVDSSGAASAEASVKHAVP